MGTEIEHYADAGDAHSHAGEHILQQYMQKQTSQQHILEAGEHTQSAAAVPAAATRSSRLLHGEVCRCPMTVNRWQLLGCMAVTCITIVAAVVGAVLGVQRAATHDQAPASTCSSDSSHMSHQLSTDLPFVEEFTALNSCIWSYDVGDGSDYGLAAWGNAELQCYTNSSNNVDIVPNPDRPGDGLLRIRQVFSPQPQPCINQAAPAAAPHQWTSGKIHTKGNRVFQWTADPANASTCTPIVIESRIKVPYMAGRWSAFWMMPQPQLGVSVPGCPAEHSMHSQFAECGAHGPWPRSGEIDIMEQVNQDDRVLGTGHYANSAGADAYTGGNVQLPDAQGWVVSKAVWSCEWVKWYVNDQHYFEVTRQQLGSSWPFDQPFYLILNTAVGGMLTGFAGPDQSSSEILVDYVKVHHLQ